MLNHLIHANEVHEIQVHHFSRNTLTKLMNVVANLFYEVEATHLFLLLDLHDANDLLVRVLAHELRRIATQNGHVAACIAIVVSDNVSVEFIEKTIRTILTRDRVQVFVNADKAHLWLQIEHDKAR